MTWWLATTRRRPADRIHRLVRVLAASLAALWVPAGWPDSAAGVALLAIAPDAPPAQTLPEATESATVAVESAGDRSARLLQRFLSHLAELEPGLAPTGALLRERWEQSHSATTPEDFLLDALAMLYPDFAAALKAFDRNDLQASEPLFAALKNHADPYLAAHSLYFHVRGMAARGLTEELSALLEGALDGSDHAERYSSYAPQLWFLRGYAAAAGLNFDAAGAALQHVLAHYPDAPEPVLVAARQLALEVERRELGTLDEVGALMEYAGHRLQVEDGGERVRQRQNEAIALLDRLIQDAQDREEQARQQNRNRQRQQSQSPRQGAERSEAPAAAAGEIGELHSAPRADPGEMWGQLPPAEREKILQTLRQRFPSRYRHLVEQYYRSVAEQK